MRKGLFYPYTKVQAVKIVKEYFDLTKDIAESEIERLAACVVRDSLDAAKYLYNWDTKVNQGIKGNIQELHLLYPYYNSVKRTQVIKTERKNNNTITKDIIIKSFRRVYPENDVCIENYSIFMNKGIVCARFPDGTFYFIVTENSVSSAYNSLDAVKKVIG